MRPSVTRVLQMTSVTLFMSQPASLICLAASEHATMTEEQRVKVTWRRCGLPCAPSSSASLRAQQLQLRLGLGRQLLPMPANCRIEKIANRLSRLVLAR